MKVEFQEDGTLSICPEDSVERMALKYWVMEYRTHGDKMIEVSDELPTPDPY